MSGVPRSQCLIRWSHAGSGYSPGFVCPDGHITLVKSWAVYNLSTIEDYAYLAVKANSMIEAVRIDMPVLAAGATYFAELWVVLHPTDTVYMALSHPDMHAWVSGAVLAGAPLFSPAQRELPEQLPGPLPPTTPFASY